MKIFGFEINRAAPTDKAPEQITEKVIEQAIEKDVGSFTQPNNALLFGAGYYPSNTGEPVTALTSLQHHTVYACVRILSAGIAGKPLNLIQHIEPRGSKIMRNHPVAKLLRQPNPWQHSFKFMSYLIASVVLRGNGYAWIQRDEAGNPVQLIPIHPDRVFVQWSLDQPGRLVYRFTSSVYREEAFTVLDEDMIHLSNCLSIDDGGALGVSPIAVGQNTIALGMAVNKSAAVLFKHGTQLRGVLMAPPGFTATKETIERMASTWEQAYAGNDKAHKVAFLEDGVSFMPIASTASDAQMTEARAACVEDICRFFNVPQHLVQKLDKATNNNIEQQSTDFVQNSLMPIAIDLEQEFAKKLLFDNERESMYFKVDFDAAQRGDQSTRGLYFTRALMYGWMTINEVREIEGYSPVDDGDTVRVPMNTENPQGDAVAPEPSINPVGDVATGETSITDYVLKRLAKTDEIDRDPDDK